MATITIQNITILYYIYVRYTLVCFSSPFWSWDEACEDFFEGDFFEGDLLKDALFLQAIS